MDWVETKNSLVFATVEERNFVLDAFVNGGIYPELTQVLAEQRKIHTPFLVLPQHRLREVEGYLSSFEKSFDEAYKKKGFAQDNSTMTPSRRKEILEGVQSYAETQLRQTHGPELVNAWLQKLTKLQSDVSHYVAAGADKETVQRLIWGDIRSLVFMAGADYYSTRTARYKAENDARKKPNLIQRIAWKLRSLALTFTLSKSKLIFGPNEKYTTELSHDPSKNVTVRCGYCGEEVLDDSVRPKFIQGLPPATFAVEKHDGLKKITAETALMRYVKPLGCAKCGAELQTAYLSRVARSVVAILL